MASHDDTSTLEDVQSPSKLRSRATSRTEPPSAKDGADDVKRRDEALRQELASVQKVNEVIEALLRGLEKAKANMQTVHSTVHSASQLLHTWTRILSQTEHNQRLILDPQWQGASQDIADMEEEAQAKQQAAERREVEEQERKAAAARQAEDEERRRAEAATRGSKTAARGRGRGVSRGASASSASTPSIGSNTSMLRQPSTSRRGTSQTGRAHGGRGKT